MDYYYARMVQHMINKKVTIFVVFCIVIAIFILAFRNTSVSKNPKTHVGVLLPLSTDFAWWGEVIRNSIGSAQHNGYAKNIEFVFEDTKCNTKDAVSGTLSLKARYPDMHMFIVGCDNDLEAMIPILNKDKDLGFVAGLSSANLYSHDFPIINLAYRLETEGSLAAEFAYKKLGVKNIGIITDNGNFGGALANSAANYFSQNGGSATIERIKYNESNPETSILKIVQSKPDAIYIQNDIPTISTILKRLDQLGYTGKRLVYYGGRDQSLIDTAGVAAEGVYVPWPISDTTNTDRTKFITTFKNLFKKDPFITAYFVYDGIALLDEAQRKCSNNTKCIEDYFYAKKDFNGVLGNVHYQPEGKIDRDFYFEQIQDGKFVKVK
jgi:branched-chain amino acid transport system substrate-binding protein